MSHYAITPRKLDDTTWALENADGEMQAIAELSWRTGRWMARLNPDVFAGTMNFVMHEGDTPEDAFAKLFDLNRRLAMEIADGLLDLGSHMDATAFEVETDILAAM